MEEVNLIIFNGTQTLELIYVNSVRIFKHLCPSLPLIGSGFSSLVSKFQQSAC